MFKRLSDHMFVSPQIGIADVADAAAAGVGLIINNRPDGESADQTPGDLIAAAAADAGIAYVAIPVTQAGFGMPQVAAMADAIAGAQGAVLAYCRSGTRSTNLWALAEASRGAAPDVLCRAAHDAGYDLGGLRTMLDMLAGGR